MTPFTGPVPFNSSQSTVLEYTPSPPLFPARPSRRGICWVSQMTVSTITKLKTSARERTSWSARGAKLLASRMPTPMVARIVASTSGVLILASSLERWLHRPKLHTINHLRPGKPGALSQSEVIKHLSASKQTLRQISLQGDGGFDNWKFSGMTSSAASNLTGLLLCTTSKKGRSTTSQSMQSVLVC